MEVRNVGTKSHWSRFLEKPPSGPCRYGLTPKKTAVFVGVFGLPVGFRSMQPLLLHPEPGHEKRGGHEEDEEDPDGQLAPGGWGGVIAHF